MLAQSSAVRALTRSLARAPVAAPATFARILPSVCSRKGDARGAVPGPPTQGFRGGGGMGWSGTERAMEPCRGRAAGASRVIRDAGDEHVPRPRLTLRRRRAELAPDLGTPDGMGRAALLRPVMRESWVQSRHQHAPVVGSLFAARVGLEAVPS